MRTTIVFSPLSDTTTPWRTLRFPAAVACTGSSCSSGRSAVTSAPSAALDPPAALARSCKRRARRRAAFTRRSASRSACRCSGGRGGVGGALGRRLGGRLRSRLLGGRGGVCVRFLSHFRRARLLRGSPEMLALGGELALARHGQGACQIALDATHAGGVVQFAG